MSLVLLFEDVNGISPKNVSFRITAKTPTKKNQRPKKSQKPELKKLKTKKEGITAKIIEIIEELAEIENTDEIIEDHIKSVKDSYAEIFHMQQYQLQLNQYKKFINAYLKAYEEKDANNGMAVVREYDDAFERTDVVVPDRDFEAGQEVMTNSEIRDIVRRKRMNWMLGAEHNYVSPDEKERYKFWKLFSKFNYISSEWCMLSL